MRQVHRRCARRGNGNFNTRPLDSRSRDGIGALYLLACSGAIVELWRHYGPSDGPRVSANNETFLRVYLIAMTVLAWLAVFTGAYVIYPWYRAAVPPGTLRLAGYPQALLQSSAATSAWHSIGMEWKEHVAWLAPISIAMATVVFLRYGRGIQALPSCARRFSALWRSRSLPPASPAFWAP